MTHGILNIVIPAVLLFVFVPILLVMGLTLMKDNINETFERVTSELEAEQPRLEQMESESEPDAS